VVKKNEPENNVPKNILLRLPGDYRDRLNKVVEILNDKYPDAKYSALSIAKTAAIKRIEELEQYLGIDA
jgi:hypothetical protein